MDMKELLNKLDNIGSDIAEDVVNEGQYDDKSREELLKMKAEAEASIKNMKPSGNDPQSQFYDETQMMMAQQHLDSINNALKNHHTPLTIFFNCNKFFIHKYCQYGLCFLKKYSVPL